MSNWGKGRFIGTDADTWVDRDSNIFDGIWDPNEIVVYSRKDPAPSWASSGSIPLQGDATGTILSGPTSGSIPIPADSPHVYIYIASGGGGGGVDFDNGQARPGGSGASGYALVSKSAVSGNVINYNIGGGGGGAGARSNDGAGGSGGNSSVTFGNFTMSANGGGGGCGKCVSNGSNGNWAVNAGAPGVLFSGNGGFQPSWLTGIDNTIIPIENSPTTTASIPPTSNFGSANNGGGAGGSGGPGAIYVRYGRGINNLTAPGPGNDYGVPTSTYTVPSAAIFKNN